MAYDWEVEQDVVTYRGHELRWTVAYYDNHGRDVRIGEKGYIDGECAVEAREEHDSDTMLSALRTIVNERFDSDGRQTYLSE